MNITLVLHRRNEKARKHDVRPMYYGHNNYEVIDKDGLLETVSSLYEKSNYLLSRNTFDVNNFF